MAPATFPFAFLQNLGVLGISSFSDKPSRDMTLGDDHEIVGVATSGLKSNYFWGRNAPLASMCPLDETTVWIVAHLQYFKLHATPMSEMLRDCRSHDIDDTA
jgi:hypothetical protein